MTLTACLYRDQDPLTPVVRAFQTLRVTRRFQAPDEARCIAEPLSEIVPEIAVFQTLSELSPEMRLQVFDRLTASLQDPRGQSGQRRTALTFLAGQPQLPLAADRENQ